LDNIFKCNYILFKRNQFTQLYFYLTVKKKDFMAVCKCKLIHNRCSSQGWCCCNSHRHHTSRPGCSFHCRSSHHQSTRCGSLDKRSKWYPVKKIIKKCSKLFTTLTGPILKSNSQQEHYLSMARKCRHQCRLHSNLKLGIK